MTNQNTIAYFMVFVKQASLFMSLDNTNYYVYHISLDKLKTISHERIFFHLGETIVPILWGRVYTILIDNRDMDC